MGHALARSIAIACALLATAAEGCGIPGPPLPPSLNLPAVVQDLSAARTGDAVMLQWTVPTENTDKTAMKPGAAALLCRKLEAAAGDCQNVGRLPVTAGEAAQFRDVLPPDLNAGLPRPIFYKVDLRNAQGKSAGESNEAPAIAGAAPPAITSLVAENTPPGIKLSWQSVAPEPSALAPDEKTFDRITRTTLSTETASSPAAPSAKSKNAAPEEHTLQTPASAGNAALDTTREWGDSYRYRVQAIAQVKMDVGGHMKSLEMAGMPSAPVEVQATQKFPPAAPQGLAVVPVWGKDGKPGMDLSWEPNTESTLAGYRVYRVEKFARRALARRSVASGDTLLTAPAFSDRDLTPGNSYSYSIVAVDAKGNVSAESKPVQEKARSGPD